MTVPQYFRNLNISTKFILWFLIIALVPLAVTTYISYIRSISVLKEEVNKNLLAIADNKANQIESYLLEQKKGITNLSRMSETLDAIVKLNEAFREAGGITSPEYAAVNTEFRPFLKYYQMSAGYMNILLVNPDGDIVFSATGNMSSKSLYELALRAESKKTDPPEMARIFIKTKNSRETEISDFEYHPNIKEISVFIAAPLFKASELVGVVIAQMSTEGLLGIVSNYNGLGRTGDIVLATRIGDEAVFITPVRFDPTAIFNRRIPVGAENSPGIQNAVQGESGFGITIDYRNREVLAVWRYLPTFRLGIAVEMDTSEVFASANKLRNDLSMVSLALLVMIVIMAILIAHSISSPIRKLTAVSGVIARGNFSVRAKVNAKDEIGELAQSFNQMTDSLIEAKVHIEEQKSLLEESNKELDAFVYTVSHDLKAPLRGIAAFSDFLNQDYGDKLDKQACEYIARISAGANNMKLLIEDLLTLSKISRIRNPYEDVNMRDLIKSVTDRIDFIIKENKVVLKIAENLPVVHCDPIKIAELFLNLLTNAIKYSSKNAGVAPKVEIGYSDRGDAHEFFVRDNGIGIDEKDHKTIFTMFKRLHRQDEYEGTGAGLSIVKKVVAEHEGALWLESELGKGATFYFTIPKGLKSDGETKQVEDKITGTETQKHERSDGDEQEDPDSRG